MSGARWNYVFVPSKIHYITLISQTKIYGWLLSFILFIALAAV